MAAKAQFFEIKDELIVGKVFDLASRHTVLITMWLKDQTVKFDTTIVQFIRQLGKLVIQFPVTLNELQFQDAMTRQGTAEIMGSFQLESVNFFFKSHFVGLEKRGVQLAVPTSVFKMQRRTNLRISFPRHQAPKLTIFDPRKKLDPAKPIKDTDILAYRMLDVSVGGIAFATKQEDALLFQKGVTLHDMRFKVKNEEVVASGIVKHTFETINDKKEVILKIGVEFLPLGHKYERIVAQFVLEESRKMFSAFM